jgi:hypothetical protein
MMTLTKLAGLNLATKFSLAQEYPSLSVCGSFDHLQLQSGPLYIVWVTVWSSKFMIMPYPPRRS